MNSKILVIGHGYSVLDSERGKEIDRFPGAIVRLNHYKIEGFEKHVGTRTDIYQSGGKFHLKNAQKNYIIVLVYHTTKCNDYLNAFKKANSKNIVIEIPFLEVEELKKELGCSDVAYATSGMMALYSFMIRGFDVYAYGFDFYRFNRGLDYYRNDGGRYNCCCHEPQKENFYFDKLCEQGRIKRF
ncbi:MAG: glycosyltransferase family 29 protein [Patescibacteria group bacterium]